VLLLALGGDLGVKLLDLLGDLKLLLGVKAELGLDAGDVLVAEGGAVDLVRALVLRAVADDGADLDQRWLVGDGLGFGNGSLNVCEVVVAVADDLSVEAIGLEALADVLGEGEIGRA